MPRAPVKFARHLSNSFLIRVARIPPFKLKIVHSVLPFEFIFAATTTSSIIIFFLLVVVVAAPGETKKQRWSPYKISTNCFDPLTWQSYFAGPCLLNLENKWLILVTWISKIKDIIYCWHMRSWSLLCFASTWSCFLHEWFCWHWFHSDMLKWTLCVVTKLPFCSLWSKLIMRWLFFVKVVAVIRSCCLCLPKYVQILAGMFTSPEEYHHK